MTPKKYARFQGYFPNEAIINIDIAGCGKTRCKRIIRFKHSVWCWDMNNISMLKRPSSKAAASEETRRTLRYVEPLSEARTPLADFFSILLEKDAENLSTPRAEE